MLFCTKTGFKMFSRLSTIPCSRGFSSAPCKSAPRCVCVMVLFHFLPLFLFLYILLSSTCVSTPPSVLFQVRTAYIFPLVVYVLKIFVVYFSPIFMLPAIQILELIWQFGRHSLHAIVSPTAPPGPLQCYQVQKLRGSCCPERRSGSYRSLH